jgi:hypothetical protein
LNKINATWTACAQTAANARLFLTHLFTKPFSDRALIFWQMLFFLARTFGASFIQLPALKLIKIKNLLVSLF